MEAGPGRRADRRPVHAELGRRWQRRLPCRGRPARCGGCLRRAGYSLPFPGFLRRVLERRVRAFSGRIRSRTHAEPGRAVQPRGQVQALPGGCPGAGRRADRHRPLRARGASGRALAAAARRRPQQGSELLFAPVGPEPAGGHAVPDRRAGKSALRRIAQDAGLPTHAKKDSTGICFIGERDFREFLGRYLPARTGEIRDPQGQRIAEHPGCSISPWASAKA